MFQVTHQSIPVVNDFGTKPYWSCTEYMNWHKALKKAYGKTAADAKFKKVWEVIPGSAYNFLFTNCSDFNAYMASEGIKISASGVLTFVGDSYNTLKNVAMPAAAVIVGGWVYLTYFRPRHTIVENRNKVSGLEGIEGFESKDLLLLAALGLGALALTAAPSKGGACTGTHCRTPAGWAIQDLQDVYYKLADVVLARLGYIARVRTESSYVDVMRKAYVNGKQARQDNLNKYYQSSGKTSKTIFEEELQAVFDYYGVATIDASTAANAGRQVPWYSLSRWF